jgi:thiosulfate dehydrogenase
MAIEWSKQKGQGLVLGLLIGLCIPVLGGLLFVKMGGMPVATAGEPLPFERIIASIAIHAALKGHEDVPSPIMISEEALAAGAKVYSVNCAICHGRPGQAATGIAKGLYPQPPQMFDAKEMVTDDSVGEVFWKVKNGIRLTGMPGFVGSLSDEDLWKVSLLLTSADKISDAVKSHLDLKQ